MSKILIIDDDKELAVLLALHLRKHKHQVIIGYDAAQGFSLMRKEKPDLLIFDIKIPAGTGFSLADKVNEFPEFAGTPIIFMSAYFDDAFKQRAKQLGAKACIEKPFNAEKLQTLLQTVESALGTTI